MSLNIIGIGTDLVAVERIQRIWEKYEEAFARRILAPRELKEFKNQTAKVSFLSKRYAAKEAVAKAIGTGFQPKSFWLTDIGVVNDKMGKPHLEFSDKMQPLLAELGISESHISLSDEKHHALAFVILLGPDKKIPQ